MSSRMSTVRGRRRRGFTLVEMLVVSAIIILLVALLMTGLRSVKRQADSLVCMSNLRQVAIDFQLVAQNPPELKRWMPEQAAVGGFGLTSFIDKVYEAGTYFPDTDGSNPDEVKEYVRGEKPFFCPSGPPQLSVRENRIVLAPEDHAVADPATVSYGFNARLYRVFRRMPGTYVWVPRFVMLGPNMFNQPRAPQTALIFDVDAKAARKAHATPHLVAPPNEDGGEYSPSVSLSLANGMRWFPSQRHLGNTNVALLDGSVQTTPDLLRPNHINWLDATYDGQWINGEYFGTAEMETSLWSVDSLSEGIVY